MKANALDALSHLKDSLFSFYLAQNWMLMPLHAVGDNKCTCQNSNCRSPAKHPLCRNGLKDGSRDSQQIAHWWKTWPFANVGIVTGHDSGIVVLDVDAKNEGFRSLETLERQHGYLPQSLRVKTGGQGIHIYFRSPTGAIKNRVGILPGLDFRGEGGYVVAPPSRHISGDHYNFINEGMSLSEMPIWLQELVSAPVANLKENSGGKIFEGHRNQTLISVSGFLISKGFSLSLIGDVIAQINKTACLPPLEDEELITIAQSTSKFSAPLRWQTPKPLPENSEKCLSLNLEHLPRTIIPWVSDITQRMQVPLEFVCGPLIIAAGSVIGRKAAIKPLIHDPWLVHPNLWGFLVAPPGSMKSPAIAEALKAFEHLSTKASAKFEQDCEQAQIEYRKLTVEIEALKQSLRIDLSGGFVEGLVKEKAQLCELQEKAESTKKVKEKRYKTNDPTIEKLALILKDNPQGILLVRDELSGWLESLYKTGREGSREFYLEAWNGNSAFSIDRIGRGTVHVEALCLSIFGGIQPAKVNDYIDRHSTLSGDDGFLERFQVVFYPELPKSWELVDKKADDNAFKILINAFLELDAIELSKEKPYILGFSVEAQEVANRWRHALEKRLRDEHLSPLMQSYLSKYRSLMPSLALIFSLLEIGRKLREVNVINTRRAITWCSILESHTRKILRHTVHNPMTAAQNLAQKIKKGWFKDQQTIRDLRRKYWTGLRSSEEIESALSALEALNWIRVETRTGRGGTTEFVRINPDITNAGGRHE